MIDDPFIDLVVAVVGSLETAGIPYAITGSIASGIHGEPIPSQDVDIVVRMTYSQATKLHEVLPQRFYRSLERLQETARSGGVANLVDTDTGLKVDLSSVKQDAFFDAVMLRARPTSYGASAPDFVTVTPEDVVLMKLVRRKDSRSDKQWKDALGIAKIKGARMDWKYLFEQAELLGIEGDLTKLRDEAGI